MAKGVWGTGYRKIEEITTDDQVASRDEYQLHGEIAWKRVEELFTRTAPIMEVWVNGQRIPTTAEHPFYHLERGWVPASTLTIGDQLASLHGEPVIVTNIVETDRYEPVYNFRVQDHHTYFVGCDEWGFSVWAHNADYEVAPITNGPGGKVKEWVVVDKATGEIISSHGTQGAAHTASQARAALDEIAATGRLPMPHAALHGDLPAGRINAANRAEFDTATTGWFNKVMIGDRSDLAGLSNRGWERYSHGKSTGEMPAIGDFDQVAAFTAKNPGYDRLSVTPWNSRGNDAWIIGHIERGADARVSSVLTDSLRRTNLGRGSGPLVESVFNRELRLLEQHGYRFEQATGERVGTGWMRRPS